MLRHWFGTRCAEEGVGPELIGEFLGHRDRGVTALKDYVEPSQKHIKSVAIKLALNDHALWAAAFEANHAETGVCLSEYSMNP
jgi:hypothetical protein